MYYIVNKITFNVYNVSILDLTYCTIEGGHIVDIKGVVVVNLF